MTTRKEIEQALAGKSSDQLNEFFDSLGLPKVNPTAATEEERRQGILRYHLDSADRRRDRFTKICRGLDLPTPEEKMLGKVDDSINDLSRMKKYLGSLSLKDFEDFYRRVMETKAVLYVSEGQRPSLTKEILECKKLDPGRWIKACRIAGIDTSDSLTGTNTNATLAEPPETGQPQVQQPKKKPWLSNNLNMIVVGVITVLLSAAILAFWTSIIEWLGARES